MSALYEFEALGTHWWIEIIGAREFPGATKEIIDSEVQSFEANYSRFKPDSYIGKLNDQQVLTRPPDEVVAMFNYAQFMNEQTDGVFNITVGGALEQLGYGREADSSAHISTNMHSDIKISNKEITIAGGIRVDFGGFGKGWLVDKLSDLLSKNNLRDHIVNGGGDIRLISESPQVIYVEHPTDSSQAIGEVSFTSGGLAASSANRRQWVNAAGRQHHIIDPMSGLPSSMLASVHIYAKNALLADSLATVFLLIDDLHRKKLAEKCGVEYLSINNDLTFYQSAGFPARMY